MLERGLGWEGWLGALILAMLGGIIALTPPIPPGSRSLEHLASGRASTEPIEVSSVQARVWEDPLIAISNLSRPPEPAFERLPSEWRAQLGPWPGEGTASREASTSAWYALSLAREFGPDLQAWARSHERSDGPAEIEIPTRVLLVEVVDGTGAEDEELRRGERIAVGRGLAMSHYGRALGSKLYPAFVLTQRSFMGISDRLACEMFSKTRKVTSPDGGQINQQVLTAVVYVPQRLILGQRAIGQCTNFAREIRDGINLQLQQVHDGGSPVRLVIEDVTIFRRDSGALIRDLKESARTTMEPAFEVRVINTGSTIDLQLIQDGSEPLVKMLERDRRIPADCTFMVPNEAVFYTQAGPFRIARMLGSDSRIAEALAAELKLRRRTLHEDFAIAVIVEGENPYGQMFATLLKDRDVGFNEKTDVEFMKFEPSIDLPPLTGPGREMYRQLKEGSAGPESATMPLGMRATDFIFRQLRDYEASLDASSGRLSAVMICAYDQHDKRPIIQLVRREFPQTLVLVLDMHALMTDPTDVDVMRNLIVGSHLSLAAGGELQSAYSPFRSCYQTSTFLACQVAFWEAAMAVAEADRAAALAGVMYAPPGGRVYEVSKQGAVLLDSTMERGDEVYYPAAPARPKFADLPIQMLIPIGIGALVLLVYVSIRSGVFRMETEAPLESSHDHRAWPVIVALVVLVGASVTTPLLAYLARGGAIAEVSVNIMVLSTIGFVALMLMVFGRRLRMGGPGRFAITTGWVVIVGVVVIASVTGFLGELDPTKSTMFVVGFIGMTAFTVFVHSMLADRPGEEVVPRGGFRLVEDTHSRAFSWSTLHWRGLLIMLTLIALAAFGLVVVRVGSDVHGEPLGWFDGVSAWPSEMIRAFAVAMGIGFVIRCIGFQGRLWRQATCQRMLGLSWEPTVDPGVMDRRPAWYRQYSAADWLCPVDEESGKVDAATLIHGLRIRCHRWPRLMRLSIYATLFSSIIVGAMSILNIRDVPIRGSTLFTTHVVLMWLLGIVLNVCVLVMLDTTILCMRYVNHISRRGTVWPDEVLDAAVRETGFSREAVSPWLDTQSIAQVTCGVNSLVYFPVILIILSATAWYPGIDDWTFSSLIAVMYGLSLPACIVSACFMRREAEYAREQELEFVEQRRRALKPHPPGVVTEQTEIEVTTERGRGGLYVKRIRFVGQEGDVYAEDHVPEVAKLIINQVGMPPDAESALEPGEIRVTIGDLRQPAHRALLLAMAKASSSPERRQRSAEHLKACEEELDSVVESIRGVRRGAFLPWSEEPIFRGVAIPVIGFASVKLAEWLGAVGPGG